MGSLSDAAKNQMLNNVLRGTASPFAGVAYVKLHTGDPGSSGTANAAAHTTRALVSFAAAASGSITSSGSAAFTNMAADETLRYISVWDASSGGNFLGRDDLPVARPVTAADSFSIAAGQITVAL